MASERTDRALKLATVLVPTLVGLVASTMLLVDYMRPAPVFCDEDGGCEALKHSMFAFIGPIPLPSIGVAAFVIYAGLALARGNIARLALAMVSSVGAVLALLLIAYQAQVDVYCKFCITADVSTVLVAIAAWARAKKAWDVPARSAEVYIGWGAAALAVIVPIGASRVIKVNRTIPPVVAAARAQAPKGEIAIVDFVDFECPFCRMTHEAFAPLLEERKGRVHVVRKQVPLRMHPHSRDAARAACCSEQLGKGDAMADALFKAPVDDLTPDGCEKLAVSLGMSLDAFRSCVQDPATDARINADTDEFRASKARGLPTIWIDDQKLEGAQPVETLREALDQALAHAGT